MKNGKGTKNKRRDVNMKKLLAILFLMIAVQSFTETIVKELMKLKEKGMLN